MLRIYNIKDKQQFLREVAYLTEKQWGKYSSKEEFEKKVLNKMQKIKDNLESISYCKLILLQNETLVGFISIFPRDGEERQDLSPWYSTMFVKEEYRGNGYSKILNNAIINEAQKRGFKRIYLKTDLDNYYEKFGAIYLERLKNGEKLYYIDL